jgi:hypothetical protein
MVEHTFGREARDVGSGERQTRKPVRGGIPPRQRRQCRIELDADACYLGLSVRQTQQRGTRATAALQHPFASLGRHSRGE